MLREFKLTDLEHFDDGRIALALDQAMRRCVADCHDRPGVAEARTVTLTVSLSPVAGEDGDLDGIHLQAQIKDKAPVRKSKVYSLDARRNGSLTYNDLATDDHHQRTLDEIPGAFDAAD
jgi:hypothetical protein